MTAHATRSGWAWALALMVVWWAVTYGFGPIPIPELRPAWFPHLGGAVTNGLSLAAVLGVAALLRRTGRVDGRVLDLAGWRGRPRALWWLVPVLVVELGYPWIGRDGVPGIEGSPGALVSLAAGMLAVGISEETASRGIPLSLAARPPTVWLGVAVTACVFGLWHLGNGLFFGSSWDETWWQVLGAATFGVCMAGCRLVTGSVWPAALLHALGNWTQLASPGAAPDWYQVAVMVFELGWGVVLTRLAIRRGAVSR